MKNKSMYLYCAGLALVLALAVSAALVYRAARRDAPPVALPPAVVLLGETVTPALFLTGEHTADTAIFAEEVETALPGKRDVVFTLYPKGGRRGQAATSVLYILEPARTVDKELGSAADTLAPLDFFTNGDILGPEAVYDLRFVTDVSQLDYDALGWHDVALAFNGAEFTATLRVTDTIPPYAAPVDVSIDAGHPVNPADFVRDVSDRTAVTLAFAAPPDVYQSGEQAVAVRLEDASGNAYTSHAKLTVRPNLNPPVITGAGDIEALLGGTVMYRQGVTAEDYFGRPLSFSVENDVDINTPGVYTATYTAADADGNETRQTVAVTVLEIQEAMLNDALQAVLDSVLQADMTQREQARAIFDWVRNNVGYVSDAPKKSVYDGAYRALQYRAGDCYTFYAISELLLTRAGIPNAGVTRIAGTPARHYWNAVNADDAGWYHFDTTPTKVRSIDRFMFTDAQAQAYTDVMYAQTRARDYYTYDRESCPVSITP